jgi:DNA gyrase subunit A
MDEFNVIGRGGQGVIAMQCSERNGLLVSAVQVKEGDELMLITDKGTLVRTRTEEISILGRNTQGVRLIKLSQENEHLVGVERVDEPSVNDLSDADSDDVAVESSAGAQSNESENLSDETDV